LPRSSGHKGKDIQEASATEVYLPLIFLFLKAVEVELADEAAQLALAEIFWQHIDHEAIRLDDLDAITG